MQEETEGFSLGDIFRTIYLKKWLALIIAAVITVAGVLLIQFGYNRTARTYVTEFTLSLPGNYTGDFYTYFDGSKFYYTDFVTYESLLQVKQSKDDFKNIDIDKIIQNNDISVSKTLIETSEEEENRVNFTISVAAKYFANQSTARAFLTELAYLPVEKLSTSVIDCDVFLTLSKEAEGYETSVSLLQSQLNYLMKGYSALMAEYGDNFVVEGKTLYAYYSELSAYDLVNTLDVLGTKVRSDGVLKSEAEKHRYELQKTELQRQLDIAEATLKVLINSQDQGGSTTIFDATVIKTQSDLVENIRLQISDVTRFIENGVVDADGSFKKNYIDPETEALERFTTTYEKVVGEVYDKVSAVTFTQVGVIMTSGGMGVANSVLISLIVGIIVALVVAFIFGYQQHKKDKTQPEKEETAENISEE